MPVVSVSKNRYMVFSCGLGLVPGIKAARAAALEITGVAGDHGKVVLDARRRNQPIDDGQGLPARLGFARERPPSRGDRLIDGEEPAAKTLGKIAAGAVPLTKSEVDAC